LLRQRLPRHPRAGETMPGLKNAGVVSRLLLPKKLRLSQQATTKRDLQKPTRLRRVTVRLKAKSQASNRIGGLSSVEGSANFNSAR
jgi:hypothetical protein